MDFGRITLDQDLILYLFGTPGQDRFWFMWDDLVRGAIGAIVLVEYEAARRLLPRRRLLRELGPAVRHRVERLRRAASCNPDEVREALQIGPDSPIITTDARHRAAAKSALITLVEHALMARLR
ncbi:ATP-binding protein OS=Streptomyces tendae OX=1932 GN=GUR47_36715 PE=3 SV=1 [Streptomyces tendae]